MWHPLIRLEQVFTPSTLLLLLLLLLKERVCLFCKSETISGRRKEEEKFAKLHLCGGEKKRESAVSERILQLK